ncbi:MAG: DUF3800 domain-containing protein [Actinomycetota bacterium]|jgi:hypothetical protein|nr:DUF3800 domain-containing protein [Actinomycetota bacterium]
MKQGHLPPSTGQRPGRVVRVPFKFVGYCDESEDNTSLVITCVFARAADWAIIVRPWQALLNEYGISEFHAEHCEHRKGSWETWTDPTERSAAARRFLGLITVNHLPFPTVYATAVDLKCFREIAAPIIQTAHPGKRLDAPWLLAFHQVLDDMLHAQSFTNNAIGTHENIDLICDEKDDFSGRVTRRVKELKETTDHPLAHVRFANSESAVGLQIADLIAYEMRKALTAVILNDETRGIREQGMQLMGATMPGGQPRIYATFWDEAAMRRGNLPSGLV